MVVEGGRRRGGRYLALELDLFVVAVGVVPLGETGFAPGRGGGVVS